MPRGSEKLILIENVRLLANTPGVKPAVTPSPCAILISGSRIRAVIDIADDIAAVRGQAHDIINGGGKVAMPGLINSHCHTYASVLRGTENSQPLEVWALFTMGYGRSLTPDLVRTAVRLSAVEMIRNGVTSVIDHIPHIGLFPHSLSAHAETGMRVGLAPFMQDIPDHRFLNIALPDDLRRPIETPAPMTPGETRVFFDEFFSRLADLPGRLIGMIGPNAPQRCSPELWRVWRDLQETYDAPVHTHLLETRAQARQSQVNWKGGLVAEMQRQGLLNKQLSAAHCIWLSEGERDLLARHGVTVVHNPVSNLMLGSGLMPFEDFSDRGAAVAIGSDSANTAGRHDIFEAIRLAAMLPRLSHSDYDKWPAVATVMTDSIHAGAGALGLSSELGQIAPGFLADLILLDMNVATATGPQLNAELIAQHGGSNVVTDVMIDGDWVLREGKLTGIDELALQSSFNSQREELMIRAQSQSDLAVRTAPWIKKFIMSLS